MHGDQEVFTGTRIGVVTARTLAQQLQVPLFGISTLAAVAQAAVIHHDLLARQPVPDIAVDMRAQRNIAGFTAIYTSNGNTLVPCQTEQVVSPESWEKNFKRVRVASFSGYGGR